MTIELIINRLIGQAENRSPRQDPLSPQDRVALSQRLRALVDTDAAEGAPRGSGLTDDAGTLAAYLDGTLDAAARAEFERDLVRSPARRDELMSTAAWLDEIAARQEMPPADATAMAMALETPVKASPARGSVMSWFERLLPGPRLALATSALASVAIVAVGVDIGLRMNPALVQVSSTSKPSDFELRPPPRTFNPTIPGIQPPQLVVLTAEVINAVITFHDQPGQPQREALVGALTRGGVAIDPQRVRSIRVQRPFFDRLVARPGRLPTVITADLTPDGELTLGIID